MTPEQVKVVTETLTGMIEGEIPATCQVIAAVKDEGKEYRPDPKSRTAWQLAAHLATADVWLLDSIAQGVFNFDPARAKALEASFKTASDIVDYYRKEMPAKLGALRALPADKLTRTLDFYGFMQMPAVQFIGFTNNHSVHHRGQLAAYLRALGSKVPNIYGPSADAEPQA